MGGGGDAPVPGDPISLVILNSTQLDPDGGGVGINPNGWVAQLTIKGLNTGDAFDATDVVLTATDPGFDATGAATTVTRTILGGEVLRRQRPNASTLMIEADGNDLKVTFSIEDEIYAGTTLTAEVLAGAYPGVNAKSVQVTNNSTFAYPKPLFAWLNIQRERATGSSFAVEAVAYHRHAMNGKQVACVKFTANDAQGTPNYSATQTVSSPAVSSFCTLGQPPESHKASMPLSNLTQGDVCAVNALVYPWIGDSSAILDLSSTGVAQPTSQPQTLLQFVNDRTGGYGGGVAYVKSGASGGTVGSSATPYPTLATALAALATWNNTNKGHNDHSGSTVYLMDDGVGGNVDHGIAGNIATASGNCWTDIKVDPAAVGVVRLTVGALRTMPSLLRYFCPIVQTAGGLYSGSTNSNNMIAFEGQTIAVAGTTVLNYGHGRTYMRNVTLTGVSSGLNSMLEGMSTSRTQQALLLGVIAEASATLTIRPQAVIGCRFKRLNIQEANLSTVPNVDPHDGCVIANNVFHDMRSSAKLAYLQSYDRGFAIVQNLFERSSVGSIPALEIGDVAGFHCANGLEIYNTVVGERSNMIYAWFAGDVGISKRMVSRFSLHKSWNTKADVDIENTSTTGRVGTWPFRYFVGNKGIACMDGSFQGTAPAVNGSSWLGEHWESGSSPNVGAITFTDDKSGSSGAGGGNYHPTGGSSAVYDRVPAGLAMLGKDLGGSTRLNDGTGAAGAYERA